ncbi:MAG: YidC/Oxa1 family membrane protein insertase [Bacillota bacterium]|nr:YidC/Oxa1 family membrane protein insertase [Bacillota bacterium]
MAVILFTIIVKIILLPLGVKQQKTMVKTKQIKPELSKIQAKYKNDKEKLNEETMKLYQKYDINPMGGCLPLLVQFPVLIGLYRVIQQPITWILGSSPISELEKAGENGFTILKEIATRTGIDITGLTSISDIYGKLGTKVTEIEVASKLKLVNFNLLGLDLSQTPSISHFSALWIIPVLATGAAFFSNWVSQKVNGTDTQQEQAAKGMTMMMPLMTLFFTFTLSAGIGVYWFMSTIISVAQMVLLTKYYEKTMPGLK